MRAGSRLRLELSKFCRYFVCARREHLDLMAIEFLLLLTTIDVELRA